jgi:hypothetical protein
MGFGVYLYPEIFFSKPQWTTYHDILDEIDVTKRIIKNYESELAALATMTEPRKFMPDDCDDPMWWVQSRVQTLLTDEDSEETLKAYYYELFKLEMLRDYWDKCHKNGYAIAPPKGAFDNVDAYMTGDFVEANYEDGTPQHRNKSFYEG